jgi:hypothetical protein
MIFTFRTVAIAAVAAGYAHSVAASPVATPGDDKAAAQLLIGAIPASAWAKPVFVSVAPQAVKTSPTLASFLPILQGGYFGATDVSSRLLFLSPLSPLRAALRVAAQDLAVQRLAEPRPAAQTTASENDPSDDAETDTSVSAAARKRQVLLRQRRRSVLNDRDDADRSSVAEALESDLELSGFNGRVELLTLPSSPQSGRATAGSMPGGAGLVRLSGHLTDDLSFALMGLAAESAATTWRAGAEFELAAGDRNRIEVGAVYGARSNATNAPLGFGLDIDRRSVGAFRVVHAMKVFDTVTTRAGGRFYDAPFLRSSRTLDPEFSVLIEEPEVENKGRSYLRFDFIGDTLFPGLEVVTGESDVIALSEGLPIFARDFAAQRTWNRAAALGYREAGTRMEARLQDQIVTHALLVHPSSMAGAPYVGNGARNRVQIGSVLFEKTFGGGQAQAGFEYGYGHFAADRAHPGRTRDFHQLTTRFDAYLRRTGTGLAIFHRFHEGASVSNYEGDTRPRMRAQRYFVELRQDVPWVPSMLGADMDLLVSLRNVYYDDVDRRNVDEFAVTAPPRRVTGGIRVKF